MSRNPVLARADSRAASVVCALALVVGNAAAAGSAPPGGVDTARLMAADSEPQNWLTIGRDSGGSYYSPLTMVNSSNATRLGFAWQFDLGNPHRAQEATPIVVDGVLYTSGTWGYVYAVDAATGQEKWRYDPKAESFAARNPCCDLVNRGVAVWKGKVYVASVDGRLHALNAATGEKLWEADTITDHKLPYSSTGAPQIAGDVVVIGNSGGDMGRGGVRGYVGAYDLESGALKWRFYTVPPQPGKAFENPELAVAAKTWDSSRHPQFQGGGTVWDGFAYDPRLKLVYFGTANAAPYDLRQLGPAQQDSLYTASIIALDTDTGRMAWYYQTTPRDKWDFDATQKMILADLTVDGASRSVIMQANKNGFFYVLDRKTGKALSAKPFAYVNWASRVDLATGRPVTTQASDWYAAPSTIYPSPYGAHTWNPMSYSAQTGLVYIPVIDAPAVWVDLAHNGGSVKYIDGIFNANAIIPDDAYVAGDLKHLFGPMPERQIIRAGRHKNPVRELIRAWDPIAQRVVWEHETSQGIRGYDGGIASTAGNLVFQGRGSGGLWVYAADTGKVLTVIQTGSHIMAAPAVYAINGEQFVAVQVGYGGTGIAAGPIPPSSAAVKYENTNRIIAFKLGGGAVPTPTKRVVEPFEQPPQQLASGTSIAAGEIKFVEECSRCHVLGLSTTPDLRKLNPGLHAVFKDIVLHGILAPAGMERFDDLLSDEDVDNIHAYLIDQSWQAYRSQQEIKIEHVTLPNGLDMAYRRVGHGSVPIVLVHGYSLSSAEWAKVLPLLPADRYTAYAVDLRGFGDSGKPVDGNDFAHLVADLAGFMDAVRLGRAVMIGHSMGGSLLQDFALAHPERVSALVFSDAFARSEPPLGISDAVRKRIDGYGGIDANRRVFEAAIPRYFDAANFTPADAQAFVADALKASNPALKGLLAEEYTIPNIPLERYRVITAPTLIVVGAHDAFVPFKQVLALTDAIPGVRLTAIIPRAGHTPMWEQPQSWAAMVRNFLDAVL